MKVDTVPVWQGLVSPGGRVFCVPVKGQKLVLPTKTNTKLIGNNEFTLDPNRLTVAESPWGGLKGSARDYAPGTVSTPTDGVYLTDINGANTSKILTAGKLKELNLLTVDTAAKTITEEFIIKNSSTSNAPSEISYCEDLTGIAGSQNTPSLDSTHYTQGSKSVLFTVTGLPTSWGIISKNAPWNWTGKQFLCFDIKGISGKSARIDIYSGPAYIQFTLPAFNGAWQKFVLPLLKPTTSGGGTFNYATVVQMCVTFNSPALNDTINIDNIFVDSGKWALVEVAVPDSIQSPHGNNLLKIGGTLHNGTAYAAAPVLYWDYNAVYGNGAIDAVFVTTGTFLDNTKFQDVYGLNAGGAYYGKGGTLYPMGEAGQSKNYDLISNWRDGSAPVMTYSTNKGSKKRVGFALCLPPTDGGRTAFNQVRLKLITYYGSLDGHSGAASYEFDKSSNVSYGLLNLNQPWLALLDSSGRVECYVFTDRPNGITVRRDDSGNIYELEIDPGNSLIYRFVTWLGDQTTDTDADLIPDCLAAALAGYAFNA